VSTVHALFTGTAARTPQADFLFTDAVTANAYGISHGPISWSQAAAQVELLRRAYAAAGYGHGHRVGLLLENRPAFLLHWFALNALGVSVVPIHADLRVAELRYLIEHSEIAAAVALPAHTSALQSAAVELRSDMATWWSIPVCCRARARAAPRRSTAWPTQNALLYTSGTTGRPKGCMLSNRYF
jgi:long-subunit acyl-CoA synthetase (AMP-forming)